MEIEFKRVLQASKDEVITWLVTELKKTARDMGNKMPDDDLAYLSGRVYEELVNNYSGMQVGSIRPILFNGMSGVYGGSSTKLTVQLVLNWIKSEYKSRIGQNVQIAERESESQKRDESPILRSFDSLAGRFFYWMLRNDLDYPDSTSLKEAESEYKNGRCTQEFIDYLNLFDNARRSGTLDDFKLMFNKKENFLTNVL